jgi:hypothetical protein
MEGLDRDRQYQRLASLLDDKGGRRLLTAIRKLTMAQRATVGQEVDGGWFVGITRLEHPASARLSKIRSELKSLMSSFNVLCKSKTIVARLGPLGLAIRLGGVLYTKSKSKNKEGRSTKYPKGTILVNINRLVALTHFP